jgi:hypothetical protein
MLMPVISAYRSGADGMNQRRLRTAGVGLGLVIILGLVLAFALPGGSKGHPGASHGRKPAAGWRLTQSYDPNEVADIVAPGSRDAWIADLRPDSTVVVHHWNGTRWRIVRAPSTMISDDSVVIAASSEASAWIFTYTRPAAGTPYAVAWYWNGSDWRQSPLPAGTMILAATAYSPTDAWAFGKLDSGRGSVQPYAAHYNGQHWQRVAVPVLASGASSLSVDNFLIVGQTDASLGASTPSWAMANWTGTSWHVLVLPRIRRAKGLTLSQPGVLALSPTSIWVDFQLLTGSSDDGAVFLHFNGFSWTQIGVPKWAATWHSNMTPDGRGGFWIAISTARPNSEMYDYRNGHWSRPDVLSKAGHFTVITATATKPGSTQAWAVGYRGSTAGSSSPRAVVYEYRA